MKAKGWRWMGMAATLALLAACGSGPVKRVSEPNAGIQQLTVQADGRWSVDLRLDNYSSVPMQFGAVSLALTVNGESAGTLGGDAAVGIGPESADVVTLALAPASAAKIAIADALAERRNVEYKLAGTLVATPEGGAPRTYRIDRGNILNPAPGLPGVLR